MDERIKKVAQKLHKSIKNYNDVGEVYQGVRTIALQQTDYFSHFGPDFLIKLTLYIYSFKTTGDFKLGEKMVNNLSFIQLISTNNINAVSECKTCKGDGYTRCGRCKGYDVIECPACDGDGQVICGQCDSDDYDCDECDGRGSKYCNKCDGDGAVECPSCHKGEVKCESCDGTGEFENDDEVVYTTYFIVTWNEEIKTLCESRVGTLEPVMSEREFYNSTDDFIELYTFDGSEALNIISNQMFCVYYSDEPQLFLTFTMQIRPRNNTIGNINHLIGY